MLRNDQKGHASKADDYNAADAEDLSRKRPKEKRTDKVSVRSHTQNARHFKKLRMILGPSFSGAAESDSFSGRRKLFGVMMITSNLVLFSWCSVLSGHYVGITGAFPLMRLHGSRGGLLESPKCATLTLSSDSDCPFYQRLLLNPPLPSSSRKKWKRENDPPLLRKVNLKASSKRWWRAGMKICFDSFAHCRT